MSNIKEVLNSEEIAIVELIQLFLNKKKYVFYCVGVTIVLGVLVALTSPYEYEAESRILSENGEVKTGRRNRSLDALSGLLGLNDLAGGGNQGDIGVQLYPEIISSRPFLLDLIDEEFYFQEKGKRMTLLQYFSQEQPGHIFSQTYQFLKSVPRRILGVLEKKKTWERAQPAGRQDSVSVQVEKPDFTIDNLNYQQLSAIDEMDSRLSIDADGRIITLAVKMPEPLVSAELNVVVLEKITAYVVKYKTEKQEENLRFIEDRYQEATENFKKAQYELAQFRDRNIKVRSQVVKGREIQLRAEYDVAFDVYRSLAQKLEESKIQLKKETPLFTEFEPVKIPSSKAEPNIPKILLIYIFAGIALGVLVIFGSLTRDYMRS